MSTINITIKASMRVPATVTARTLAAVHKASTMLRRATGGEVAVGIDMPNGATLSPTLPTKKLGRPRGTGRPLEHKAIKAPVAPAVVVRRPRRRKRRVAKEED